MGGIGSGRNPRWKDLQIVDICKLSVSIIGRYLNDESQSLRDRAVVASHFAKRMVPERIQAEVQRKLSQDEMTALTENLLKALAVDQKPDAIDGADDDRPNRTRRQPPALTESKRGSYSLSGGTGGGKGSGNPPPSAPQLFTLEDQNASSEEDVEGRLERMADEHSGLGEEDEGDDPARP